MYIAVLTYYTDMPMRRVSHISCGLLLVDYQRSYLGLGSELMISTAWSESEDGVRAPIGEIRKAASPVACAAAYRSDFKLWRVVGPRTSYVDRRDVSFARCESHQAVQKRILQRDLVKSIAFQYIEHLAMAEMSVCRVDRCVGGLLKVRR